MNLAGVFAIAGWELRLAVRGRLVMGTAVTFTVVCVLATLLGLRSVSALGLAGVGPGTGALINLAILFPPLMGIMLGANSLSSARERSILPLLHVPPLPRPEHARGVVPRSGAATCRLWPPCCESQVRRDPRPVSAPLRQPLGDVGGERRARGDLRAACPDRVETTPQILAERFAFSQPHFVE